MTIRVLHDGDYTHPGGGARVAKEIAKALDASITVGHSAEPEFWKEGGLEVDFAFQGEFQGTAKALYYRMRPLAELRLAQRFHSLELDADTIISSGTAAKWINTRWDQNHIHYCHTPPPRFYESHRDSILGWSVGLAGSLADEHFTGFCDELIANSEFTKARILDHYGRDAQIIYPPVRTERFGWLPPSQDQFLVMVGRLNQMKRADVVAQAWEGIDDVGLVLIGDGPLKQECAAVDGLTVYSSLSDWAVEQTVARSIGGIAFAELEHCGLTPKEFQAAGKPVLVPDEPNLCNHVTDGETGIVTEPTVPGVRSGVRRLLSTDWGRDKLQETAAEWSVDRFHREVREFVSKDKETTATEIIQA